MWGAVTDRLRGARVVAWLGDARHAAELERLLGVRVTTVPAADVDVIVAYGGLLCAADRSVYLSWLAGFGRRIVHILPAAPGADLPDQQVSPTYADIACWFGPDVDIACSVEAVAEWGVPARCWIVAYEPGQEAGRRDEPERKRLLARPVPTVSACMIIRDAESTVLTTLQSLLPIADEIRIVDTGSVDATREIIESFAKRAGGRVHLRDEPWPHDFAAARNLSTAGASGDWILWIDADERLLGAERLRRLLQTEHVEAYAIRQHNHIFDHGVTHVEIPFRVYRNGRGYRFFGAVHEHPERALNEGIEPWTLAPGVEILHYGYLDESTRRRKLLKRNLALLQRDLDLYPGRRLTDVLYLRDAVNLARFDMGASGVIRPDHVEALQAAITRYEQACFPARDRYYRLGREYYDQALAFLGLGADLHVQIGGSATTGLRFRVRHPSDAMMIVAEETRKYVTAALGGV